MALICAISHEVPEHPVVSPTSGNIFERNLIVKYIEDNGVDPINGEALTVGQLIPLKVNPLVKPRPPSATSIPAILKLLQDEWDACMLHTFTLRQQLQTSRQELSHALYQHDAACRVIARLTKEVTAAREALATLKPHAAASYVAPQATERPVESMEVEHPPPGELPEEVAKKPQDVATMLTAERKKRGKKAPEGLTPAEQISDFQQIASHPGLHSASIPGILALDLSADSSRAITGGADKNVVVFHKESEQIVATLKGHSKKVTSVIYHPKEDVAITASPDTTIRVWTISTSSCKQIIKAHDGPVSGISLHATGDYILSASADQYWAFSDFRTGRVISKANDPTSTATFTCIQFHPDGLTFGTGSTDSDIKIWDLKERANVANFAGHSGKITSIAFSENGFQYASSCRVFTNQLLPSNISRRLIGQTVWDLHKLKNFRTINLEEGYEVNTITFDQSGTFLAVGGSDVRNLIFALSAHNQYAGSVFPGVEDAMFEASSFADWQEVDRQLSLLAVHIRHAANILNQYTNPIV